MSRHTNVRVCATCGGIDNTVYDTRVYADILHRRRLCNTCGHRYSTVEIPDKLFKTLRLDKVKHERLRVALRAAMIEPDPPVEPDPL